MRGGEATLKLLVVLALAVLVPAITAAGSRVASLLAQAPADGWLGPIIGNATAASILGAVVLWLGPKAIAAWQSQQDKMATAFFGNDESPGAIGRLTAEMAEQRKALAAELAEQRKVHAEGISRLAEQMDAERKQCALQFERTMASQTLIVERLTEVRGMFVQARHVSVVAEGRGDDKDNPGR